MSKRFARTWWGLAWIEALETRARLDPNRLPRGRTYARQNRVESMTVEPGVVSARVQGTRPSPYVVMVRVRRFTKDEWERVLDTISSKAGHTAAMLDGEMEPGIVADARRAGVELFPTAGDVVPACSCPDWADPCKHSAAVCYLVADRLDLDPFDLLLLRGMARDQVMAALRARRSSGAPTRPAPTERLATMSAREAWARKPRPLPAVPPPPRRAARAAPWPSDPPPDSGLDGEGLRLLAADAVRRAYAMSRGEGGSGLSDDVDTDLARRAAVASDRVMLAKRTGTSTQRLDHLGVAWAVGGAAGVEVLGQQPWTPDPRTMAEARHRLAEAGATNLRVAKNSISFGEAQVRLAHDGRWWPFTKHAGRWQLTGSSSTDPEDLLDLR
ncbi:MAG: SWIM zinc finger family protein [Acidimicrobiia bacterium]